jgi:arginase
MSNRIFHILGVPLRSGSMMPGTENDAPAYRDARVADRLRAAGVAVVDEGDLALPSYLPHHTVPPVRNWPGPRIVWDLLAARTLPFLGEPGHVPLLIGCDCSVVVATVQALASVSGNMHVLYIDGDCDDAPPQPGICQSAAAMALWLITNRSPFWSGPPLQPSQVTVIGWSKPSSQPDGRVNAISLADVRRRGAAQVAREALAGIPASAGILVHFDIDVIADRELPAAYFPHSEGLTLDQTAGLLGPILADPRVRVVEVSEYSALRDPDRAVINKLVDLLTVHLTS